jgi:hypothetical protein
MRNQRSFVGREFRAWIGAHGWEGAPRAVGRGQDCGSITHSSIPKALGHSGTGG